MRRRKIVNMTASATGVATTPVNAKEPYGLPSATSQSIFIGQYEGTIPANHCTGSSTNQAATGAMPIIFRSFTTANPDTLFSATIARKSAVNGAVIAATAATAT